MVKLGGGRRGGRRGGGEGEGGEWGGGLKSSKDVEGAVHCVCSDKEMTLLEL